MVTHVFSKGVEKRFEKMSEVFKPFGSFPLIHMISRLWVSNLLSIVVQKVGK